MSSNNFLSNNFLMIVWLTFVLLFVLLNLGPLIAF